MSVVRQRGEAMRKLIAIAPPRAGKMIRRFQSLRALFFRNCLETLSACRMGSSITVKILRPDQSSESSLISF